MFENAYFKIEICSSGSESDPSNSEPEEFEDSYLVQVQKGTLTGINPK